MSGAVYTRKEAQDKTIIVRLIGASIVLLHVFCLLSSPGRGGFVAPGVSLYTSGLLCRGHHTTSLRPGDDTSISPSLVFQYLSFLSTNIQLSPCP